MNFLHVKESILRMQYRPARFAVLFDGENAMKKMVVTACMTALAAFSVPAFAQMPPPPGPAPMIAPAHGPAPVAQMRHERREIRQARREMRQARREMRIAKRHAKQAHRCRAANGRFVRC